MDQEWAKVPRDNRQTDKLAFRPRNWLSSTARPRFTFQNIAFNDAQLKTFQNISDQEIVIYLSKTAKYCFQCNDGWPILFYVVYVYLPQFQNNFLFVKKLRFFDAFYFCWRTQNFSLPPLTCNKRQLHCKPLRSGKKTKWDPSFLWS